jgi:pyruvate/oxaloacetate carboxyltransferase
MFFSDRPPFLPDDVAERYGVSLEALKELIKGQNKPGYLLLGDQVVSKHVLEKIKCELIGVTKHSDAFNIFRNHGVNAWNQALSMLGYKVKWSGLDPENAEIAKI